MPDFMKYSYHVRKKTFVEEVEKIVKRSYDEIIQQTVKNLLEY